MRLTTSTRSTAVPMPPESAYAVVASGRPGPQWYADAAPLVLRGALDRVLGGPGRRWPAPDRPLLSRGDRVGFWRVVAAGDGVLDLEAEVRAPGSVRLRTEVLPDGPGSRVDQRVSFAPDGLLGAAYLLADLPARETLIALVHRRLLRDLTAAPPR
ncbi:DUF2867 domain-containing protein [Nocardioides donggukensis]|uniref:DUF2867 domain-containing protein n=1 Tax=Nocardioides donggukensis TaxID=2774019 RepID=A0A927K261_9ACTN|nr:DUF2867 domain-containing protein [Nocardioides donggukensis]MBD8868236.1 DUF2867 domain-containing protein [Nocardioides donggukensis]